MTDVRTGISVTLRYFAAASAAAGTEQEVLEIHSGASVRDVVDALAERNAELSRVLARCSYLLDGVAVRDLDGTLVTGQTLDVLPPFAGG